MALSVASSSVEHTVDMTVSTGGIPHGPVPWLLLKADSTWEPDSPGSRGVPGAEENQ